MARNRHGVARSDSGGSGQLGASPTGAWSGKAKYVANFFNGAWFFIPPLPGAQAYAADEDAYYYYDAGGTWTSLGSGGGSGGTSNPTESLIIAIGDETTAITTGTAKVTFRMPYAFTLSTVRASLTTASSSGTPTVDINEAGTTILSTKLTIDMSEKTSTTAATPAVISDPDLADDTEITIDIDTAGTDAAGLKVYLIGSRP
ncbi:DUF2793 domain-containing protein [Mesorhizobium sp. B2-1-8]|nr:DUF2793 domain-containing protein [Mesorhizobium sp. B2-1-8]